MARRRLFRRRQGRTLFIIKDNGLKECIIDRQLIAEREEHSLWFQIERKTNLAWFTGYLAVHPPFGI